MELILCRKEDQDCRFKVGIYCDSSYCPYANQ